METTKSCSLCGHVIDPEDGLCSVGCDDVWGPPDPGLRGPTLTGAVLLVLFLVAHSLAEGPTMHLMGLALGLLYAATVGSYLSLMRGFGGPGLGALVLVLFAVPCGLFLAHLRDGYN